MFNRQKVVGWTLIIASAIYLAYFVRVRLLTSGPVLEKKDWINLIVSIATLMIGTANVRLAAMRRQKRRPDSD